MVRGRGGKRRWLVAGLAVLACVVLAGLGYAYSRVEPYARIGSAYVAKQMCSCLYVAGRSEASCRAEFQPDIARFKVSLDPAGLPARAAVTTSIAVFSSRATYARGFGCTLPR